MAVVCGTDFSELSEEASILAALLARRWEEPLRLLHVREMLGRGVGTEPETALVENIGAVVARLEKLGVRVEPELLTGLPDAELVAQAGPGVARLLVVGALGRRVPTRYLLGSIAERVVRAAEVPVLVARHAASFRGWLQGRRRLRVVVCVDRSLPSRAALRWAADLAKLGPCDVTAVRVVFPPTDYHRLGVAPFAEPRLPAEQADRILREEVEGLLPTWPEGAKVEVRLVQDFGATANALVGVAEAEKADLVVVGTRQIGGMERVWRGSVATGVLRGAESNVACIPVPAAAVTTLLRPEYRKVLVCTDLSELGNRAVAHACAATERGGELILMNVLSPTPAARRREKRKQVVEALRELIPDLAAERGLETSLELVEHRDVAGTILAAAERLRVDLICVSSHGRSGLARTLAGSVAQTVMLRSERPVLVVRPPAGES